MHSINHHLISIRVALEAMPSLGYALHPDLDKFREIDTKENNRAFSLHQSLSFWRTMKRCYPEPSLALNIAQAFSPQVYGMFGFAMLSCASMRETLKFAVQYQQLSYTLMTLSVDFGERYSSLCFAPTNLSIEPELAAFFADRDLASTQVSLQTRQSKVASAQKVTLVHDGYGVADQYRDYFNCEVEFNSPVASLIYRTDQLDFPALYRNHEVFEICRRECDRQLAKLSDEKDVAGQVRQELFGLPGYLHDIESISRQLGLSSRTLRRRLLDQGLSFQSIQQEVRFQQAKEFLTRNQLSIAEISDLLGFSEPGNFTQAFKRWSAGWSPRRYRQSLPRSSSFQ